MIISLFVGLFVAMWKASGMKVALSVFGLTIVLVLFILTAVHLITSE